MGKQDVEEYLKSAPPEELLFATEYFYRETLTERESYFLRLGFNLRNADGWEHVAPAWLRNYKAERQKKK